ncbi:cytochrome P450 [Micromonospora polyrhachis]|uniref:Unspecific monooxygenase n=1 Tax=Micromonospora polyrhachis TaxID=1282883 RepID=A0A7W7SXX0_9ACTN|nr:cytochrome P450 [Micromonospora polyrhachis]MBB4962382.1 unspecific monooxygenase [Micromonospora polyrhachis]
MTADGLRRPVSTGLSRVDLVDRYERDRLGTLLELTREYGPMVEAAPGTILVTDPTAAHEIYQRTNTDFLMSLDALLDDTDARRGTDSLDRWMVTRRAALAAIGRESLATHATWLDGELSALADRWLADGFVDDPVLELRELTLRSFSRFCFGTRDATGLRGRLVALDVALRRVQSSPLRVPVFGRLLPRHRRARQARQDLATEISRALASPGSGGLAEAFVGVGTDQPGVVRMLLATATAAYGVPAAAIGWVLHELSANPEVAEQVAQAGAGTGYANPPPLVDRVVDECLRLWPPTWLVYRSTDRDQTCAGWLLPAGSAVMLSPFVTHRTATCYDEPERFRPERWCTLTPPRGAFTPFGAGPRWCLGARFAKLELTRAATILTGRLRFSPAGNGVQRDVRGTLTPVGLRLTVTPR